MAKFEKDCQPSARPAHEKTGPVNFRPGDSHERLVSFFPIDGEGEKVYGVGVALLL